jgi:uncharacterized membrane protein
MEDNIKPEAAAPSEEKKEGTKVNAMALISYMGILFIIPYLRKEKDEFAKFHAKQGLVLFLAEIATWAVFMIPFLGILAGNLIGLLWVILSVIGIINVVNNKKEKLPLIGDLSEKLKF